MQFQKNAKVLTAQGQPVGKLERVVLNPESKVVTHIVISRGSFFKKEAKVLPVDLIAKTTRSRITLCDGADELNSLPDFRVTRYGGKKEEVTPPTSPGLPSNSYGTPMVGIPITAPDESVPVILVSRIFQKVQLLSEKVPTLLLLKAYKLGI